MKLKGKIENGVVVLPPGSELPDGTEVEIETLDAAQETAELMADLLRIASSVHGLPADLARNHDHYLYGRPKRP